MSKPLPGNISIEIISDNEYEELKNSSELIIADRIAPKVMRKENGNYLKFFRRKRLITSAMFAPYALRFVRNASRLVELGISTVKPVRILHCPAKHMHIVEYEPLGGELLRGALERNHAGELLEKTACFIALLHHKGVYFRSLHFENIVIHNSRFGLIDIADMKIYPKPLNKTLRQRNFQHFLRYPKDNAIIKRYGLNEFNNTYQSCVDKLSS